MRQMPMKKMIKVFTRNYEISIRRVLEGEELKNPIPKALPKEVTTPLSKKENLNQLKQLRQLMAL